MNSRKEEIAELKRRIEALEKEVKQWEPVSGGVYVTSDGRIATGSTSERFRLFGAERPNKQQAEKARDKMRAFNRLLAYHDEFCPDVEFTKGAENWYIYYNHDDNAYCVSWMKSSQFTPCIFFESEVAIKLMEKLNSGEVVL